MLQKPGLSSCRIGRFRRPACNLILLHLINSLFVCLSVDGDVPPPGIRGQRKTEDKKSGSSKLLIGLVVTFGFLVFIALAVLGYVWYRRKRNRHFDYQKQVLYSEDKAEEFEIFT